MNNLSDSHCKDTENTQNDTHDSNHLEWRTEAGDHISIRFHRVAGSFCGSPSFFEVIINDGPPRRAYSCIPVKTPSDTDTVARLLTINLTQEQYSALQQIQQG